MAEDTEDLVEMFAELNMADLRLKVGELEANEQHLIARIRLLEGACATYKQALSQTLRLEQSR